MSIRPLPYPDPENQPDDEPRPPRKRNTALLLAALFGPFGLFYVSVPLALLMLFAAITAGMFTVGVALFPIWIVCIILAAAASTD